MKILAVDPGEMRIGVAVSDPTGTIARPLGVVKHQSRANDAQSIVELAHAEEVEMIVIGQALDADGEVGHRARKAERLAEAIRARTKCVVKMWDESGTTRAAVQSRIEMGVPRKKRKGHLDDIAASILLQDFLMANEASIRRHEVPDEPT